MGRGEPEMFGRREDGERAGEGGGTVESTRACARNEEGFGFVTLSWKRGTPGTAGRKTERQRQGMGT